MPISETMNTGPRLAFVGCASSASASVGAGGRVGQAPALVASLPSCHAHAASRT